MGKITRQEMLPHLGESIEFNIKEFGGVGDGVTDDSKAIEDALNYVKSVNGKLISEKNKIYLIKQNIVIDTDGVENLEWDMKGSTLDFTDNANIKIGKNVPFKTTVIATDLIKGESHFDVADAAGVEKGDLFSVESPVTWDDGTKLRQTYTIGDVDGNTIYVNGLIIGDLSERQKTDAGVTGDITVKFYKLSKNLTIKNGVITSMNRDGESTLFYILGQENYLIENITVKHPTRSGVSTKYCGTGQIVNCRTIDHGYVEKDQGYSNDPDSPDGLSYGYGFISAECYLTHYIGCHSYAGWHGFDIAVGQTIALFDDCVIHKDAFGFSSHPGSWLFQITNCKVFGGEAITSRSAEIIIKNNVIRTNGGRCIIGSGKSQRLIIKNNILDVSGHASSNVFWLQNTNPDYCYSLEKSYAEVSDNTILGIGNASEISFKGDLVFKNNEIYAKEGGTGSSFIKLNNAVSTGEVLISDNHFHDLNGQQLLEMLGGTDKLAIIGNEYFGATSFNGALVYLSGTNIDVVLKDNIVNLGGIVRVMNGDSTFTLLQNNAATSGVVVIPYSGITTVKNAINNTFSSSLIRGTDVVPESDINNNALIS